MNAITTIRQYDRGASEIILVSAERPYARMVLPYYLKGRISESRVYTATLARLQALDVQTYFERRAARLDTQANVLTLDDGTELPYDDLLIATGSSAVRPPVPGANDPGVHSFWTQEQAQNVECHSSSWRPPHRGGDRAADSSPYDRPARRRAR
jgi:NADPH-dependent 2,4-dienoyl-CoA reductase/sulfur reductase-like enzyme